MNYFNLKERDEDNVQFELLSNDDAADEERNLDRISLIKKRKTGCVESIKYSKDESCSRLSSVDLSADNCTINERNNSLVFEQDSFQALPTLTTSNTNQTQPQQPPQQPPQQTRKISRFTINVVSQLPFSNLDTSLITPVRRQASVRFDNQKNESNRVDSKSETVNLNNENGEKLIHLSNHPILNSSAEPLTHVHHVISEHYKTVTATTGAAALAMFAASIKGGENNTHDNDLESLGDLCLLCPREHLEGELYEWLLPTNSTFHSRRLPCNCTEMRYVHMECLDRCGYIQQKTTLVCPWCKADLQINRKRHIDCNVPKLLRHSLQLCLVVSFVMVFVVWSFIKEGVRVLNSSLLALCCLTLIIFIICKLHTIFGHYDYAIYRPRRSALQSVRSQKTIPNEKSRAIRVV